MMAMNYQLNVELNSFISKLVQLNSYGINANLNVTACDGKIKVSLHADLGHDVDGGYAFYMKPPKPSRLRRRLKRKEKIRRAEACNNNASNIPYTTDEQGPADEIETIATDDFETSSTNEVPNATLLDYDEDTLHLPFKTQNESENATCRAQQIWTTNELFKLNRLNPTCEALSTAQQCYPRMRSFTEDELTRMLRMKTTYQPKHQNSS